MSDYDPEKHWRFKCTACGYTEHRERPSLKKCPNCDEGGWNMIHYGPVVITDSPFPSIALRKPR